MTQLGYDVPPDEIARRLERRGPLREVFVAERAGTTLGWAAVRIDEGFVNGRQAWIEGFVVGEDARGAGIGSVLLDRAESWARERACDAMRVQSNVLRERAHGFYERHGYRKLKAQFAFRKVL